MEENTQTPQAENMGPEEQGTESKESKLFTQDEVNGFVQSRIFDRIKAKNENLSGITSTE